MIPKCTSWLGHNFEARFDKSQPTLASVDRVQSAEDLVRIVEASKQTTYVHDICTRCGHVVPRSN